MIKGLTLLLVIAQAAAVEVDAEKKAEQTYTISAAALKAKVQAEAQKIENARVENSQKYTSMVDQAKTMTHSAHLQEMAGLVEGRGKGAEMIKTLSAEAKDALAGLHKMWLDVTMHTVEGVEKIQAALPK